MKKRLYRGMVAMLFLIILVLAANQLIIGLFSSYTNKLILENHELYALEELKGALGKILIEENQYLLHNENIRAAVDNAGQKVSDCRQQLSHMHKGEIWMGVELMFAEMKQNVDHLLNSSQENATLKHIVSHQILDLIASVESLVEETVDEISEYEEKSKKARIHGSITIVIIGIALIAVLALGGFKLIRSLTRPIEQLLGATEKISAGNRYIKVHVDSQDEFKVLAESFNTMLDALNETSISEKYLSNILNHLYGALMVTDTRGNIRSVNSSTTRLLLIEEKEIIGRNILEVFGNMTSIPEGEPGTKEEAEALSHRVTRMDKIPNKKGKQIPVYVTSVILKNQEGNPEGMVVVAHDLTEEKKNERKMEKLRKESMVAFHEAQEMERLRISRELHDGLGQLLTGISYSVQQVSEGEVLCKDFADQLQKQVDTAIQEARNISQNLTPIVLKDFGLVAAIENLVQRSNLLGKTNFVFDAYSFTRRINKTLEKAIYRICQEAVTNILKHANAGQANIELYLVEDMIVLVIEDNGTGFNPDSLKSKKGNKGFGLISMRERVHTFDGDFSMHSREGEGTEIVVEIPCLKAT